MASASNNSNYDSIRAAVDASGEDERVEVNQRALIDKILARYASAGAVYRELLQNSNDAEATQAEILFTTDDKHIVTQVVYRNNGLPFRPQDWARLKSIAEGNPSPEKVGAFGVGAYTMFSISEEPMVLSGPSALKFVWKGDALWTKTTQMGQQDKSSSSSKWTTFVLPSRDPYPLPDWVEFGQFLAASLTFTKCLSQVRVRVNDEPTLSIEKTRVQAPRLVSVDRRKTNNQNNNASQAASSPSWTSWFTSPVDGNNNKITTSSPRNLFHLEQEQGQQAIYESLYDIKVILNAKNHDTSHENDVATIRARLISANALTKLPKDMVKRMHRVTKKNPPASVPLQIYLDTTNLNEERNHKSSKSGHHSSRSSKAYQIAQSFRPPPGGGRIFIGFRTSQTTGVAAHVSAPFLPTVEREAMDLQDATLRIYNTELLHTAGMMLRFTLQHAFLLLHQEWILNAERRRALWRERRLSIEGDVSEHSSEDDGETNGEEVSQANSKDNATEENGGGGFMGFARFMARGVQKKLQSVVTTVEATVKTVALGGDGIDYNALVQAAPDGRPLCPEERSAILLMQSFCPIPSTPDPLVGTCLATGFGTVLPNTPAPCLSNQGVVPANLARLPAHGMEAFCKVNDEEDKTNENATSDKNKNGNKITGQSVRPPMKPPAVVRHVIWEQTQEYHQVIASQCRALELESDLLPYFRKTILTQEVAVRLVQWWKPYSRILGNKLQQSQQRHSPHHHHYSNGGPDYTGSHIPQMVQSQGLALKDAIRFTLDLDTTNDKEGEAKEQEAKVIALKDYLFYLDKELPLAKHQQQQLSNKNSGNKNDEPLSFMPMPETVLPSNIQELLGASTLADASFKNVWFQPLPMELWMEFMSHHPILTAGSAEHNAHRLAFFSLLHQEYKKRMNARHDFGQFCRATLSRIKCLPYDPPATSSIAAKQAPTAGSASAVASNPAALVDVPSALYLYSAELKAFESVGSFHKVSKAVQDAGVTEEFLLALGVRKSVSIDFLFSNLDSLEWSQDPRPLVEYLKSATLTQEDLQKLSRTKYLPAERQIALDANGNYQQPQPSEQQQQNFAPSELYLPSVEIRIFPFIRLLQWPTETELSERSENGRFLVKLGMKVMPPLSQVLQYLCSPDLEIKQRLKALDFVANHLSPSASYHVEYNRWSLVQRKKFNFLPCTSITHFVPDPKKAAAGSTNAKDGDSRPLQLNSPPNCFSTQQCAVMGFSVLSDELLGGRSDFYSSVFHVPQQPEPTLLIHQLINLVGTAKRRQESVRGTDAAASVDQDIMSVFAATFNYLSHRSSDFSTTLLNSLRSERFIPCCFKETNKVEWFHADQVFFRQEKDDATTRDSLTEELFQVVDFSPFLAAAGVKQDATTKELFKRLLQDPKSVMKTLGGSEKKYRALLRRIAADPPFSKVTDKIRKTPFLLAYTLNYNPDESKKVDSATFDLAAADDIFIIDNSFFGRMFRVNRAPHETDLEDFYAMIGAHYISKSVDRRFEVVGRPLENTALTRALQERVSERAPLLVSPHVTTRPMVNNAASLLDPQRLEFQQASSLLAVYSLRGTTRRSKTTCFSRQSGSRGQKRNSIFVVEDFDWFDVGYAIGDFILKRCQLEDAFFISSLLDAPLEQLRARGFPVDRILAPTPVPEPEPVRPAVKPSVSAPGVAKAVTQADGTANIYNPDGSAAGNVPPPAVQEPKEPPMSQSNAAEPPKSQSSSAASANSTMPVGEGGIEEILEQMFPDADPEFIRAALGPNPTLEDVQRLAKEMASGNYPKRNPKTKSGSAATPPKSMSSDDATVQTDASGMEDESLIGAGGKEKKKRPRIGKKLGRALGFGGGSKPPPEQQRASTPPPPPPQSQHEPQAPVVPPTSLGGGTMPADLAGGMTGGSSAGGGNGGMAGAPASNTAHESTSPVAPAEDLHSQQNLERMLEQTAGNTTNVNRGGLHSNDTVLTSVPEGLDRGEACEVIDGQSLKPFPGPRNDGKTRNGIRVFSSAREPSSELLLQNVEVVESFALLLSNLARVFGVRVESMAIFNEPGGRSIAFNSNRALHFNLRFFYALHFMSGQPFSRQAYSYWYITMAHELSHNLVSAHNKEHGFYTESFATHYLPKLVDLLADL